MRTLGCSTPRRSGFFTGEFETNAIAAMLDDAEQGIADRYVVATPMDPLQLVGRVCLLAMIEDTERNGIFRHNRKAS
ncbi:MAG: hypothetical protein ABR591_00315 [Candidatus Velthaea sp.]